MMIMLCFNISDIAIITVKGVDYFCIISALANVKQFIYKILNLMIVGVYKMHISKINIRMQVCNCYFNNLIKAKKLEPRNILIDEKNYKDLVNYFNR